MSKKSGETLKKFDFEPRGEVFPSPQDWKDQFISHLIVDGDEYNIGISRKGVAARPENEPFNEVLPFRALK